MDLLRIDPSLRSLPSPAVYLYIENETKHQVDVYWIDFHSRLIKLTTLEPFKGTPINTYALHPWVFIDRPTGQLLNAFSEAYRIKNRQVLFGRSLGKREKVFIQSPMKSLQDITLLSLLKQLQNVDVVDRLEIPQILKRDLRKVFRIYDEHRKRLEER
ncbi:hypothetical protein HA402_011842 [Bradysia odoriphaga]|nr:hypothetical protein HA402_011842 [Bradysia odoriphaga]